MIKPESIDFLAGDSEMAKRMCAFDFSDTPLGPVSGWPQSLRSAVNICLTTHFPIVLFWGPQLAVLYNDAYIPMLADKHPWALGKTCEAVWNEIFDVIGPLLREVMKTGVPFSTDDFLFIMQRKGYKEETHFQFSYGAARDESGAVGGIFCVAVEITDRVFYERRLATLSSLKSDAKNPMKAAEDAAQILDGHAIDIPFSLIYLLDKDGKTASLAGCAGLPADSQAAPVTVDLTATNEKGWPLAQVAANGKMTLVSDLQGFFGDVPARHWPDPPHSAAVLPLMQPGQQAAAGLLVLGISPRRAFDEAYRRFFELASEKITSMIANADAFEQERRRAEALSELDRAKTTFFSNVSHEFRTPLTLMLGPMEELLAKTGEGLPAVERELVSMAHRNGLRLLKLVNTLLDFSRIEAGRIQASYEPTDLASYTVELASVFRSAIEKAGLHLNVDCAPLPEPVFVDRDMWEKIVLNLLSNAFKFTFEGEITVSLRWRKDHAELIVADTGVGIPENELPRLFERFHRVEGTKGRSYEGTGIGLALIKELIKLHGGTIGVQSQSGRGSRFTVSIPAGSKHLPQDKINAKNTLSSTATGASPFIEEALRWLPDEAAAMDDYKPWQEKDETFDGYHRQTGQPCECILVIDDNADMRSYLHRILSGRWTVELASDGPSALEAINNNPPDIVLADIMMPGMDGMELLRRIRENPVTREIPVILLSARAGEEARVEGMEHGADDYLVKPFSARELMARVAAHLDMARMRRETAEQIRQSEEKYRLLFENMTEMFQILEPIFDDKGKVKDFRYIEVNKATEVLTGKKRDEIEGRMALELFGFVEDYWFEMLGWALNTREPVHMTDYSKAVDLYYDVNAWNAGGGKVAIVFSNITERKRMEKALCESEQRHAYLLKLSDALRPLSDAKSIQAAATRLLTDHIGASLSNYTEYQKEYSVVGAHMLSKFPATMNILNAGRDMIISDISVFPAFSAEERAQYTGLNIHANATVPLIKEGKLVAALSARQKTPRSWTPEEVELLRETAERTWAAVERAKAEEALRKAEERFNTMANAAPILIWETDKEGIVFTNRHYLDFFSVDADSVRGMGWARFLHPDDAEGYIAAYKGAFARREAYTYECRFRRADGEYRWLLNIGRPLDEDRFVGSSYDITDQKKAEEVLKVLSENLTAEMNTLNIFHNIDSRFIKQADAGAVYNEILDAAILLTGADCANMHALTEDAETLEIIAIKGYSDEFYRRYRRLSGDSTVCLKALENRARTIEEDMPHSPIFGEEDRRFMAAEGLICVQSTPMFSAAGNLLGIMSTHYKSPHKFNERELRVLDLLSRQAADVIERVKTESALQESEGKYRVLFESIDEGYCIIEVLFDENDRPVDYSFLDVNKSFEKQTGLVNAVGRSMRSMVPGHEQHWFDIYGSIALTGESVRFQNSAKALGRFYDVYAFRVGKPEQRRVAILFNDISEHKQAEDALKMSEKKANELVKELEEADNNKNQFLSALSHELRNPLAAISAGLQLMDITQDEDKAKKAKDIINRQMNQLCRLVDDLLDLTRISNNKIVLKKEQVELNSLALLSVEDHLTHFNDKKINLYPRISANAIYLHADPVRLKQIIGNLLHNALKYTPRGGEAVLTVCTENREAVISVKDNGIGLSSEIMNSLFQPFVQADTSLDRSNGGLGLGLSIAKGIVELHGGTINAYSEGLGKGSEFTIRLPLSDEKNIYKPDDANKAGTSSSSLRILIIEDNKDLADLTSTMLAAIGYRVEVSYDGPDGLDKAKRFAPDVIFCDIGLPGMDGFMVAKNIKDDDALKGALLVALTGYAQETDIIRAKENGFDRHLAKPVKLDSLQRVLNDYADERKHNGH